MARKIVPNIDQKIAALTKGAGISPIRGKIVTYSDNDNNTGKKAIKVMTESIIETPRPSIIEANLMVSSCTLCAAPSIVLNFCH